MKLLAYINPKSFLIKNDSFKKKTVAFFLSLFFLILVIVIWGLILKGIDVIFIKKNNYSLIEFLKTKQANRIFSQSYYLNIIKIIVAAPILEEIAYRLPLNLKKHTVIISLITFCAIYLGGNILSLNLFSFGTWSKIGVILIIALFGHFYIKQSFLNKIKDQFYNVYFYFLALLFAADHISIYITHLPSKLLILAPLFIIPQFFLALTTGYVRMKNGIIWAILLHVAFNTPTVLNYIYST